MGKTITRSSGTSTWNNTSYVNVEVDSMIQGVYKWYIRIDKCMFSHIFIAVSGNKIDTEAGLFSKNDYVYWSCIGEKGDGNADWKPYGDSYGDDDEIGVVLDLKKREISFEKNGKSQGVA